METIILTVQFCKDFILWLGRFYGERQDFSFTLFAVLKGVNVRILSVLLDSDIIHFDLVSTAYGGFI